MPVHIGGRGAVSVMGAGVGFRQEYLHLILHVFLEDCGAEDLLGEASRRGRNRIGTAVQANRRRIALTGKGNGRGIRKLHEGGGVDTRNNAGDRGIHHIKSLAHCAHRRNDALALGVHVDLRQAFILFGISLGAGVNFLARHLLACAARKLRQMVLAGASLRRLIKKSEVS